MFVYFSFRIDHWDPNGPPLEETLHPGDEIRSISDIDMEDSDVDFAYGLLAKVKGDKVRDDSIR